MTDIHRATPSLLSHIIRNVSVPRRIHCLHRIFILFHCQNRASNPLISREPRRASRPSRSINQMRSNGSETAATKKPLETSVDRSFATKSRLPAGTKFAIRASIPSNQIVRRTCGIGSRVPRKRSRVADDEYDGANGRLTQLRRLDGVC